MSRQSSKGKHYLVFLQTPKGGVKDVTVRASSGLVAGKRAEKRNPGCKTIRVEQGI